MLKIIVGLIIVYFIFKIFGKALDYYTKNYNDNEYHRGYNYALKIYNDNAKDESSHDAILERIYNESDIGFEFAGNDQYDRGMRDFYFYKRGEGFK